MKPRSTNNGQFVADPNCLQQRLLHLVESGETNREVMAEQTGATMQQVRRGLSNLAARGLIEPYGTAPGSTRRAFNAYQVKGRIRMARGRRVSSVFQLGMMR